MPPKIGQPAPAFSLPDQDGNIVSLKDLRGKPVVLYFYPADDTPGCTAQACDFRDSMPRFKTRATIIGVSPDTVASHKKFRDRFELPFTLLADTDHNVAEAYDVWKKKKMFGHEFMGIARTTFLIDSRGNLADIIPAKPVAGHSDVVLARIKKAQLA